MLICLAASYGPRQANTSLWAYVKMIDPDQSAHAQTDQGLPSPLTDLLDSTEFMNGEQLPG